MNWFCSSPRRISGSDWISTYRWGTTMHLASPSTRLAPGMQRRREATALSLTSGRPRHDAPTARPRPRRPTPATSVRMHVAVQRSNFGVERSPMPQTRGYPERIPERGVGRANADVQRCTRSARTPSPRHRNRNNKNHIYTRAGRGSGSRRWTVLERRRVIGRRRREHVGHLRRPQREGRTSRRAYHG